MGYNILNKATFQTEARRLIVFAFLVLTACSSNGFESLRLSGGDGGGGGGGGGNTGDAVTFTWKGGSQYAQYNGYGRTGVKGVGSTENRPGARTSATTWIDASGNLWFFGGDGFGPAGETQSLNDLWKFEPSSGKWTWVSGTLNLDEAGSYGTMGVASAANLPGGRNGAVGWTDASGNLWLFGGEGLDSTGNQDQLNDLWKYNPTTNQWTWMSGSNLGGALPVYGTQGVGATSNIPGGRNHSVSWIDASGNFWLFGGEGYDVTTGRNYLNDLWKFEPSSGKWTWISGSDTGGLDGVYGTIGIGDPTNFPGSRAQSVAWIDGSGNFWVFGGVGKDGHGSTSYLNDLWKYDVSSGEWTWISGSDTVSQDGVYGTRGTGSTSNTPGGRREALGWTDSSGSLWVFGGWGVDAANNSGQLNDLWEFDPATGEWTWVSGDDDVHAVGVNGTQGVGSTSNAPGARYASQGWIDASGNLWIFGGSGFYADPNNSENLNDLWKYETSSGKWTWVNGPKEFFQPIVYGTKGFGSTSNAPGARSSSTTWTDASGNLWLFGGRGYDNTGSQDLMNDLWKYEPSSGKWTWVSGSDTTTAGGVYGTQGTGSTSNTPGARADAVSWIDASGNLWLFGGQGYDGYGNNDNLNDLWKYEPSSGKWTWVSGSDTGGYGGVYGTKGTASTSYTPGARESMTAWKDADGNFWLFGGHGIDNPGNPGDLADLWKFNPTTNEWTWVSGSDVADEIATYGTKGTGSTANAPGSRYSTSAWVDSSGNFWLFGGQGYDGNGDEGDLHDLWKFEPSSGKWTWVSGSDLATEYAGTYGTKGTGSTSNIPSPRYSGRSWVDTSGNFWLLGGQGVDVNGQDLWLNDLWKYNPSTNEWTWVAGSDSDGQAGVYGTLGTSSASNILGARITPAVWNDSSDHVWVFGGYGVDSTGAEDFISDLWRIDIPN